MILRSIGLQPVLFFDLRLRIVIVVMRINVRLRMQVLTTSGGGEHLKDAPTKKQRHSAYSYCHYDPSACIHSETSLFFVVSRFAQVRTA